MSLTSKLNIGLTASQSLALDLGTAGFNPSMNSAFSFADGSGANQANQIFTDQRTLAGSTSEELDLSGGLTDVYANVIAFTKIKAIYIKSAATNGGDLDVGGSATNGFNDWVGAVGDLITIKPGGAFVIVAPDAAGFAVTAATADLLKIANADAGSATYDITIIGVE